MTTGSATTFVPEVRIRRARQIAGQVGLRLYRRMEARSVDLSPDELEWIGIAVSAHTRRLKKSCEEDPHKRANLRVMLDIALGEQLRKKFPDEPADWITT